MELWGRYRDLGYLENHDGACDYEDMNNQTVIEAYKVFAKDNIERQNKDEIRDPLNNVGGKCSGPSEKRFPEK